jgi:hypothetical protein
LKPRRPPVAVKQIRVSDLSGKQADDDQLARLVVHEHPQHRGPITLDVLPEEIGELPESESLVSIEVIQPGDRSGQRAVLTLDQFNKLAGSADMNAILMNAVAAQAPSAAAEAKRTRRSGAGTGRSKVNYATLEHAGEPHRGRITEAEKELVRGNLDKINQRLRDSGLREIDATDSTMKERYGL